MKNEEIIDLKDTISRLEDIDVTDLDGEKVMMDLNKGQYFVYSRGEGAS